MWEREYERGWELGKFVGGGGGGHRAYLPSSRRLELLLRQLGVVGVGVGMSRRECPREGVSVCENGCERGW